MDGLAGRAPLRARPAAPLLRPHVALPPPVGIRQGEPAYPILPAVDDEPTFVASTQEWGLAEWPEAEATASALVAEDTIAAPPPAAVVDEDQGVLIVPLPPPIPEIEETIEAEILIHEEYEEIEDEPAPVVEVIEAVVVAAAVPELMPEPEPELAPGPAAAGAEVTPAAARDAGPGLGHCVPPRRPARIVAPPPLRLSAGR